MTVKAEIVGFNQWGEQGRAQGRKEEIYLGPQRNIAMDFGSANDWNVRSQSVQELI